MNCKPHQISLNAFADFNPLEAHYESIYDSLSIYEKKGEKGMLEKLLSLQMIFG